MADSKSILIVRPASLDDATRAAFAEAGVLVVEANEPDDVRLLTAEPMPPSGSDMLYAAICTIAAGGEGQRFVVKMRDMMVAAREAKKNKGGPPRDEHGRFMKPQGPTP